MSKTNRFKLMLSCISKSFLLAVIGQFITLHGRRILFVTTLYFQFSDRNQMTRELLEKLNQALQLANDKNALFFPAKYHRFFWNEEKLKQKLIECGVDGSCSIGNKFDINDTDKIAQGIFEITPQWLHYGRREDMINDLKQMLSLQPEAVAV